MSLVFRAVRLQTQRGDGPASPVGNYSLKRGMNLWPYYTTPGAPVKGGGKIFFHRLLTKADKFDTI